MQQQWIGIDIGTQGTKGVLFGHDFQPIGSAFEASNLITPRPNVVWQEAREIQQSVVRVMRSLMSHPGADAKAVHGIGIDSQMAGVMGVNASFEAVTVYDSWLDTRCGPYIDRMRKQSAEEIVRISGGPVSCTHGPKILWWMHEQSDVYRAIAKFVMPHVYVVGQLCQLDVEDAYLDHTCIHYSCFGDNQRKQWSDTLTAAYGVSTNRLPKICSPFDVVGKLSKRAANECNIRSGIPVIAGAGDTAASVFGSGMLQPGSVLDCAGTASVFCGATDTYGPDVKHQTLSMMRSPLESLWHPLAYISGGGMNIRWLVDNFCGEGYAKIEAEAEKVPIGCDGLMFMPHWSGRVLPNDPALKGAYLGLDWKHTRGHMYRAMMEAIAYEYLHYLHILEELSSETEFTQGYAIGGGAKSQLMLQIKSDALGIPLESFTMHDAAAFGSAVMAAKGCGAVEDLAALIQANRRPRSRHEPDINNHAFYQRGLAAYQKVIQSTAQLYHSQAYQDLYREGN